MNLASRALLPLGVLVLVGTGICRPRPAYAEGFDRRIGERMVHLLAENRCEDAIEVVKAIPPETWTELPKTSPRDFAFISLAVGRVMDCAGEHQAAAAAYEASMRMAPSTEAQQRLTRVRARPPARPTVELPAPPELPRPPEPEYPRVEPPSRTKPEHPLAEARALRLDDDCLGAVLVVDSLGDTFWDELAAGPLPQHRSGLREAADIYECAGDYERAAVTLDRLAVVAGDPAALGDSLRVRLKALRWATRNPTAAAKPVREIPDFDGERRREEAARLAARAQAQAALASFDALIAEKRRERDAADESRRSSASNAALWGLLGGLGGAAALLAGTALEGEDASVPVAVAGGLAAAVGTALGVVEAINAGAAARETRKLDRELRALEEERRGMGPLALGLLIAPQPRQGGARLAFVITGRF